MVTMIMMMQWLQIKKGMILTVATQTWELCVCSCMCIYMQGSESEVIKPSKALLHGNAHFPGDILLVP